MESSDNEREIMLAATCRSPLPKIDSPSRKWLSEARRTGVADSYTGKRREPRCSWDVQVTIDVLGDREPGESYYANSRDISARGMGLRCRRPVPTHALVRITIDETGESAVARVAQCTRGICDYHIGVEFIRETGSASAPAGATAGASSTASGGRTAIRTGGYSRLPRNCAA